MFLLQNLRFQRIGSVREFVLLTAYAHWAIYEYKRNKYNALFRANLMPSIQSNLTRV